MNTILPFRVVFVLPVIALLAPVAQADDGVWIRTNTQNATWWANANLNWQDSVVANGAGAIADFSQANTTSTSLRNIELDQPVTLGTFYLGDPSGINRQRYSINGPNALTFDNNGTTAKLFVGAGNTSNAANQITTDIRLADSLDISVATSTGFTISTGTISAATEGVKQLANRSTGTGTLTISATIADGDEGGSVAFVQDSATSTTQLTGVNSYSGGTYINAGSLSVNADERMGAAHGIVSFNGGTLILTGSSNFTTIRNVVINSGGGTFSTSGGAEVVWNGNVTGEGSLAKIGTGTLTFGGALSHEGGLSVSAGILTLTGTNSYQGHNTIFGGELGIHADENLGHAGNDVIFDNGSTAAILATNESLTSSRNIIINGASARIGTRGSGNHTIWNGVISGTGMLDKRFVGTLELTQANTYEGGTIITAGALIVSNASGSATGTGDISLNATNSVLGGTGIIAPAPDKQIWVTSGTIRPGIDGQGALTLAFSGDSKLDFWFESVLEISLGADSTKIVFSSLGDWLEGSGNATLRLNLLEGFTFGQQYVIFENVTTQGFTFANVEGIDGYDYSFEWVDNTYVLTVIPEPGTISLLVATLACCVLLFFRPRNGLKNPRTHESRLRTRNSGT